MVRLWGSRRRTIRVSERDALAVGGAVTADDEDVHAHGRAVPGSAACLAAWTTTGSLWATWAAVARSQLKAVPAVSEAATTKTRTVALSTRTHSGLCARRGVTV